MIVCGAAMICEILRFVDDLAVAELHDTHRIRQSSLVSDCAFGDPEISASENPLDLKPEGLPGW